MRFPVFRLWSSGLIPSMAPMAFGANTEEWGVYKLFPAEVLTELHRLLGGAGTILSAITVATRVLVVAAVLLAVFAFLAQRRRTLAVFRALGAGCVYILLVVWIQTAMMIVLGDVVRLGFGMTLR